MGRTLAERADNAEARARIAKAKAQEALAKATVDAIGSARQSGGRQAGGGRAVPTSLLGSFREPVSRIERRSPPRSGSATAHRDPASRAEQRRRCQDVLRNNPLVRAMVNRKVQLILGDGPRFTSDCQDKAWATRAEALLDEWANGVGASAITAGGPGAASLCGRFTLSDILAQAIVAAHTDGRMLTLSVIDGDHKRPALQVIEDERVVNPGHKTDTQTMAAGVEMSDTGRPIRYYIADYDPRGTYVKAETAEAKEARSVIDWSAPGVHAPNLVAPEPLLQVIIDQADQWMEALESTVIAYRLATLFGAIVASENAQASALDLAQSSTQFATDPDTGAAISGSVASDDGSGSMVPAFPGMIYHTSGGTISQLRPEHPSTGLNDFDRMLLGKMASALDLSVDAVAYDYDGNWSASRARLTMVWRALSVWRHWVLTRLHAIARWRLAWAIDHGELEKVDGWDRMSWRLASMPVLDPEKEVKAALDAVGGMLSSRSQQLANMGQPEFERVASELAREQRLIEASGLSPEPRQGTATPAPAQPSQTEHGQAEQSHQDTGEDGTDA